MKLWKVSSGMCSPCRQRTLRVNESFPKIVIILEKNMGGTAEMIRPLHSNMQGIFCCCQA